MLLVTPSIIHSAFTFTTTQEFVYSFIVAASVEIGYTSEPEYVLTIMCDHIQGMCTTNSKAIFTKTALFKEKIAHLSSYPPATSISSSSSLESYSISKKTSFSLSHLRRPGKLYLCNVWNLLARYLLFPVPIHGLFLTYSIWTTFWICTPCRTDFIYTDTLGHCFFSRRLAVSSLYFFLFKAPVLLFTSRLRLDYYLYKLYNALDLMIRMIVWKAFNIWTTLNHVLRTLLLTLIYLFLPSNELVNSAVVEDIVCLEHQTSYELFYLQVTKNLVNKKQKK